MEKEMLIDLINEKLSQYEIANRLNICQSTVKYWLKKFNLKTDAIKKINTSYKYYNTNWEDVQKSINEGKTYKEICKIYKISAQTIAKAKKNNLIKTRNTSEALKLYLSKLTPEERLVKLSRKGNLSGKKGGYREGAGRGKKFKVIDSYGNVTCLQSSYELKLSIILDFLSIEWIRPKFLNYTINNKNKKYFPDFYLTDYNIYIDTKNNYLATLDEKKINFVKNQNDVNLYLFLYKEISVNYIINFLNLKNVINISEIDHKIEKKFDDLIIKIYSVNIKFCKCGKKISKKSTNCIKCSNYIKREKYCHIEWPSNEELYRLVWELPTTHLVNKLGISDAAISRRCKKLGIPKPPRGYWGKFKHNKL